MHDHSRFQRDIDDVTGVSLSLSLYYSQKSLTHNIGSASALPIIKGINAKSEILKRKRKVEGRGRGRKRKPWERKRKGKGEML